MYRQKFRLEIVPINQKKFIRYIVKSHTRSKVSPSSGDNAVATNCVHILDLRVNCVYKHDYAWNIVDHENSQSTMLFVYVSNKTQTGYSHYFRVSFPLYKSANYSRAVAESAQYISLFNCYTRKERFC